MATKITAVRPSPHRILMRRGGGRAGRERQRTHMIAHNSPRPTNVARCGTTAYWSPSFFFLLSVSFVYSCHIFLSHPSISPSTEWVFGSACAALPLPFLSVQGEITVREREGLENGLVCARAGRRVTEYSVAFMGTSFFFVESG